MGGHPGSSMIAAAKRPPQPGAGPPSGGPMPMADLAKTPTPADTPPPSVRTASVSTQHHPFRAHHPLKRSASLPTTLVSCAHTIHAVVVPSKRFSEAVPVQLAMRNEGSSDGSRVSSSLPEGPSLLPPGAPRLGQASGVGMGLPTPCASACPSNHPNGSSPAHSSPSSSQPKSHSPSSPSFLLPSSLPFHHHSPLS